MEGVRLCVWEGDGVTTRVLGLLNQQIKRPDMKFRQGFWGPKAHEVGWGITPLHGVRIRVCPGVGLDGWPGWVCPPLWWWCVQSHVQYPVLAPRLFRSSSWVFLVSLYLFVHNLPQLCMSMQAVIFYPLQFPLYFVAQGHVCPGAHCLKRSQVPGCLRGTTFHKESKTEENEKMDFPGSPVAKTPHSRCRGPGFNHWSGN